MIGWGATTDRILLLLAQEPLTKADICRKLSLTHDQVAPVLSRLKQYGKRTKKRIYVHSHTRHTTLGRTHIRAIYSLGDKPDKECKILPFTQAERSARSYEKRMARKTNSVFNQTLTRRQLTGKAND